MANALDGLTIMPFCLTSILNRMHKQFVVHGLALSVTKTVF